MKEFIKTFQSSERTILVGLITPDVSETQAEEYLDELAFLSETAGAEPVARFLQRLDTPNPATFVGKGKLDEITEYVSAHEVGLAIFDDELAPNQLRNIERQLGIRILDRTSLILDIFAENKLFATLDTTVRKVVLGNLPFLLADTVGFIRKLPTQLVESFKSTLDEVRESDLILHVVDISHPEFEDQIAVVTETLREIDALGDKPQILVFNKIDAYQHIPKDPDDLTPATKLNRTREELEKSWMARMGNDCTFISARTGEGMDELRRLLYDRVKEIHIQRYPYNDFLYQDYSDLTDDGAE